jgi:ABC-type antimicrobial peptide transport system ATPase subunit
MKVQWQVTVGHITRKAWLAPRDRHRLKQQPLARRHARERVAFAGRNAVMPRSGPSNVLGSKGRVAEVVEIRGRRNLRVN